MLLYYGAGMAEGSHQPWNLPMVLVGGGAGQFKGGRHLRYPDEPPLANLHLSVLRSSECGWTGSTTAAGVSTFRPEGPGTMRHYSAGASAARLLAAALVVVSGFAASGGPTAAQSGGAFGLPIPLIDAAKASDLAAVRALVDADADVNAAQSDGATALHWAVYREDLETATLLIRAGADVNKANDLGVTPLLMACTNGHAELVEALLAEAPNRTSPFQAARRR